MKKSAPENLLMVAASESDANLYYATRFVAPDPFIFMRLHGKAYLLMNDLEVDRARKQASVDTVPPWYPFRSFRTNSKNSTADARVTPKSSRSF